MSSCHMSATLDKLGEIPHGVLHFPLRPVTLLHIARIAAEMDKRKMQTISH
jgi:hypothetical protein